MEEIAEIQQYYEQEASKRRRPDGLAQFVELNDCESPRLRKLVDDPWVDHEALDAQQLPLHDGDTCKFLITGAGLASITFAVRILDAGLATPNEICFVDAAGGFGGAWYWNRFPGLHCDSESYVYLPLLEETGYVPKSKYSSGFEIREQFDRIAAQWNLHGRALFRTEMKSLRWDDARAEWTAGLQQGGKLDSQLQVRAKYVYLAAGALVHPQIPKIPGLESFHGSMFHTARWNYSVSGGSQANPTLDGLRGKRVGIIGTGCTAIQVVPYLAEFAKEVYVFQRTPAPIHSRGQKPTDPQEFRTKVATAKGWQLKRSVNYHSHISNSVTPGEEDLVNDSFTRECRSLVALLGSPGFVVPDPAVVDLHQALLTEIDLPDMSQMRARIDEIVEDPATARKLKPCYAGFCKRPTFSDDYLPAFNLPHVHLVDTDGQGVSSATPRGLVANGKEYLLDVIIFSTGYRAPGAGNGSPARKARIEIIGRNGVSFDEKWQNRPATLHGMFSNGFPNLIGMSWANAGVSTNFALMVDVTTQHLARVLADAERQVGDGAVIDVNKEAEESWTTQCLLGAAAFGWLSSCTPSLHNNNGEGANEEHDEETLKKMARYAPWPNGFQSWMTILERWRREGCPGLTISKSCENSQKIAAEGLGNPGGEVRATTSDVIVTG